MKGGHSAVQGGDDASRCRPVRESDQVRSDSVMRIQFADRVDGEHERNRGV